MHYDREGRAIGLWDWAGLLENYDYRRVAEDHIGPFHVSTVWLGLDHGFGRGRPLIFETMVFGPKGRGLKTLDGLRIDALGEDLYQRRYSSEAEALVGHASAVKEFRRRILRVV